MKTRLSHIVLSIIPALFALSVIFAATAYAEGKKATHAINPTAMGESIRSQLNGEVAAFQFAIERNGALELTGESAGASPLGAVALVKTLGNAADASSCHVHFGDDIDAALIVEVPSADLPQLCAVLGEAYDAAQI